MQGCLSLEKRACRQISAKPLISYFLYHSLVSGYITNVTTHCMCVCTHHCIPVNSTISLFSRYRNHLLHIPAKIRRYLDPDNFQDIMCVSILHPSAEYLEFVRSIEKRRDRRVPVKLMGKLTYAGMHCPAYLMNVSERGMHITATTDTLIYFIPGRELTVEFRSSTGEELRLNGIVKWETISSPWMYRMIGAGIQITDPPPVYREFVRSLRRQRAHIRSLPKTERR